MKFPASADKKKGKVPQLFFIGASPYDPIILPGEAGSFKGGAEP
jgi:hypothetical protein